MAAKTVRTTCGICQIGCGALVHMVDGRPVKIEGDPGNPLNRGRLCQKGYASLEYLNHPDRLTRPLRRMGVRGGGLWAPIEWDEALALVARRFEEHREAFGPESIVFLRGAAKGLQDSYLTRFANALGAPNISSMAHVCFIPRHAASLMTYGFHAIPDLDHSPRTIIVWGENVSETLFHVYDRIGEAVRRGASLIVVDPGSNRISRDAHLTVKVKPGSDLYLALAMLQVIISEGLFDRSFVEEVTTGFAELADHVAPWTPGRASEITWIPPETIVRLARTYACEKPAVIQWGNGIDHSPDNFQTARAICILRAITGNLGVSGGDIRWVAPPLAERGSPSFTLQDRIPPGVRARRITGDSKLLPTQFYALPQAVMETMITGLPYPVKSCYIQGCNPLLTYPNARKVRQALEAVDFLVVADMFMTPTAALADLVLPVATYLEFDSIVTAPYSLAVATVQQRVARVGQCQSDYEILKGLADRLDLSDTFWPTEEECLDVILKPAGITFSAFREIAILEGRKSLRTDPGEGFPTPSGKVDLYSRRLDDWGFPPLPGPATRDGMADQERMDFPLLLTSTKVGPYRHSGGRQIPSLRKARRSPTALVHPDTAAAEGIMEGDTIIIETEQGHMTQTAAFDPGIDPRVIVADFAWWFPERTTDVMGGWDESNVNVVISDAPPFGAELGTPGLRGIVCRIAKHSD